MIPAEAWTTAGAIKSVYIQVLSALRQQGESHDSKHNLMGRVTSKNQEQSDEKETVRG